MLELPQQKPWTVSYVEKHHKHRRIFHPPLFWKRGLVVVVTTGQKSAMLGFTREPHSVTLGLDSILSTVTVTGTAPNDLRKLRNQDKLTWFTSLYPDNLEDLEMPQSIPIPPLVAIALIQSSFHRSFIYRPARV